MKKMLMILLVTSAILSCKKDNDKEEEKPKNNTPAEAQDTVIEISTSYGKMYMWLYKQTPLHRANFCRLADSGFFNGTAFHRVIPNFVIQGGDPLSADEDTTNDGTGGPGYTIPAEFRDSLKHVRGAVGAARLSDAVNPAKASSGSQFYVCMSTSGTQFLNGNYTVFGYIMKGMEVADSIVGKPRDTNTNRPYNPVTVEVKVLRKTLTEISSEYGYTPPTW